MDTNACVEICYALEDYTYGEDVKISIPTMNPLMSKTDEEITSKPINLNNIMNKDKTYFNNIKSTKCSINNYITVKIPIELYGYKLPYYKDWDEIDYKGHKGDKFVISFIGGSLDNPVVLRRID